MSKKLKSPYPFFGGKSRVADVIWKGFGHISNYVEPFGGSLAVLLSNPSPAKIETVNDINCFISNFWRAISKDPEAVAKYAIYPVHATELHARHRWCVNAATDDFKKKMHSDVDFYDAKLAGYWIWGMGASIGNNWLQPKGLNASPMLSSAGGGIHGLTNDTLTWFKELRERTKRVRIACGDWNKLVVPSITYNNKGLTKKDITGVFLDPPYDFDKRSKVYKEKVDIFDDVVNWAVANGNNSRLRIILCGYEGDHDIPSSWTCYSWTSGGGLASLGDAQGKTNASRERIWFSPYCIKEEL